MNNQRGEHIHGISRRPGAWRLAALGGLLLSALWLGGCSSRSFFVYRDSWDCGRQRFYERDRWHHDWGYGWGHYGHDHTCGHDHYR